MLAQPTADTFADGLATRVPFELTFSMIRRYVDEIVTVSEEEMCDAIRLLVSEVHVIAEGAGAAPTAAAMKMDLKGKRVAGGPERAQPHQRASRYYPQRRDASSVKYTIKKRGRASA